MKNEKRKITILEIFLLVVAIFAFAWIVQTEVGVVSASVPVSALTSGNSVFAYSGEGISVLGLELGAGVSSVMASAAWAAAAYMIITLIADAFASVRNAGDISNVAGVTAIVTVLASIALAIANIPVAGWVAAVIIVIVTAIFTAISFQNYAKQIYTYHVSMWQPSTQGNNCDACNRLELVGESICSEYTCHSYGLACEWINDGEPAYETCVEIGQGDSLPPVITPLIEVYGQPVFSDEQYRYESSSAGARIVYANPDTNGCVPAFTTINLALGTNENAQCKISIDSSGPEITPEQAFASMKPMAEGAVFTDNHTFNIPSSLTASENSYNSLGISLTNGGIYTFYVRCMDIKENINDFEYTVEFCVHNGPDLMPPEITGTNPPEDSYIPHDVTSIEQFQVYTNEPAICKWDTEPKTFEHMNHNFDSCSRNFDTPIRGYDYGCQGTLTGFVPEQENTYYIACMDQPELVGTPRESQINEGETFAITFIGSQELFIEEVGINEKGNNSIVYGALTPLNAILSVSTTGGAENGNTICQHSNTGTQEEDYAHFYNGGNLGYASTNTQKLNLVEGTHKYNIKCEDIAGNVVTTMINFSVQIDDIPPQIVRIYKENNALKMITNEIAECYYSTFDCIYDAEEGIIMDTSDGIYHSVEWNTNNDLYIKCQDAYGGSPGREECSLIARPFEIHEIKEF